MSIPSKRRLARKSAILCIGLSAAFAGCESSEPTPAEFVQSQNAGANASPSDSNQKRALQDAAAAGPAWQPTAEMLGLLSDQKVSVGPYAIRVPAGYAPGSLAVPNLPNVTTKSGMLTGPVRSDGSTPQLIYLHITPDSGQRARFIDEQADRHLRSLRNLHNDLVAHPTEVGRIGELGFARFRWKGVSKQGGFVARGLAYFCWDGTAVVQFTSQAREGDQAALDAAEAAILSLSK